MRQLIIRGHNKLNSVISFPLKKNRLTGALVVLNFHQVADSFDPLYHTKSTFTYLKAFKKLIRKIHSEYGILSVKEGVARLSSGNIKNEILFVLTFDDGDISLKGSVIPFLTQERIPATFFLNTAYLDNQSTNWVRAYQYLRTIHHQIFGKSILPENVFNELRNTYQPDRYNKFRRLLEDAFANLDTKPEFSLSKDDLSELDPEIFHFGLHGHQHQRYSMLTQQEQYEDIEQNIDILQKFMNYLPFWAIPFGTDRDWNRHTIDLALNKELLVFHHTNGVNFAWNGVALDRIPSDGRYFSALISGMNI